LNNTTTIAGDTFADTTNLGAVTGFTGDLTAATKLDVETAETSTVGGALDVGTLDFSADGRVDVTGTSTITTITVGTDQTGTLVMTGNADVNGTIGAANSLALMNVNGATNDFAGAIDVDDINLGTGTTTFHGDVVSVTGMDIGASGNVIFGDTADYNSAGGGVLTNSGGDGTVTFNGTSTVGTDIGTDANRMSAIYVSGTSDKTVTFNGEIFGDGTTFSYWSSNISF